MTKHVRWGALLLGLVFGALALAQAPTGPAGIIVSGITGTVNYRIGDGNPQKAVNGQTIPVGARITTGAGSNALLTFPDGQIVALGARSRLIIRDFFYDPKDIEKSRVILNVTDGSVRIVMGAIGQHDPGLIQLQVGTKTTAQTPHVPRGGDLGLVMLGSATLVQVNQGQVALRVSGQSYTMATGQGALVQADGFVRMGGPAQLETQAGQSADDKAMFDQFREIQQFAFPRSARQTMITLASPSSVDAAATDTASATLPTDPTGAIETLEPPSLATLAPITAATGAGGGGTPCTASCN